MERQDRYVYQYYTDPWPHAVVDDFFPEDYFWQLRKKFPDVFLLATRQLLALDEIHDAVRGAQR